eukprot:5822133-Prymnesium_polylepis.1
MKGTENTGNTALTSLDISRTSKGIGETIASALQSNRALTRLGLVENELTEKGALAIGKALEENEHLALLD